jgi:hypothetical protein
MIFQSPPQVVRAPHGPGNQRRAQVVFGAACNQLFGGSGYTHLRLLLFGVRPSVSTTSSTSRNPPSARPRPTIRPTTQHRSARRRQLPNLARGGRLSRLTKSRSRPSRTWIRLMRPMVHFRRKDAIAERAGCWSSLRWERKLLALPYPPFRGRTIAGDITSRMRCDRAVVLARCSTHAGANSRAADGQPGTDFSAIARC